MKLLKDTFVYAIKVDCFMYDEKTDTEYVEPMYLSIDTETKTEDGVPMNIIIFLDVITENLRTFDSLKEAKDYISKKCSNACNFENPRVIKVGFDHNKNTWKEVR